MAQRVRMDVPTHADPAVRDLFAESELFVRSFAGAGFGLLSPLDLLRLLTLLAELASHALVLWSLTARGTHLSVLLFTLVSAMLPLVVSWACAGGDAGAYEEGDSCRAWVDMGDGRIVGLRESERGGNERAEGTQNGKRSGGASTAGSDVAETGAAVDDDEGGGGSGVSGGDRTTAGSAKVDGQRSAARRTATRSNLPNRASRSASARR